MKLTTILCCVAALILATVVVTTEGQLFDNQCGFGYGTSYSTPLRTYTSNYFTYVFSISFVFSFLVWLKTTQNLSIKKINTKQRQKTKSFVWISPSCIVNNRSITQNYSVMTSRFSFRF